MEIEIKFRAWDSHWRKMDFGRGDLLLRAKDDEKVMQFTGPTDKNWREIYEGDIIRYQSQFGNGVITAPVKYDFEYGILEPQDCGWPSDGCVCAVGRECEVIGNIYENPELLEK